jgi:hypothetical protein
LLTLDSGVLGSTPNRESAVVENGDPTARLETHMFLTRRVHNSVDDNRSRQECGFYIALLVTKLSDKIAAFVEHRTPWLERRLRRGDRRQRLDIHLYG